MAERVTIVRRSGWWGARTVREKRLILVMTALLALVLAWLLLVRPLVDARAAAEARLTAAVTELARAKAAAAAMPVAAPSREPVPLPLDGFLQQSAGEQGLTNIEVRGDGPARAQISIASARPQALFGWIAQLEQRGVVVESLTARTNSDQTINVAAALKARNG